MLSVKSKLPHLNPLFTDASPRMYKGGPAKGGSAQPYLSSTGSYGFGQSGMMDQMQVGSSAWASLSVWVDPSTWPNSHLLRHPWSLVYLVTTNLSIGRAMSRADYYVVMLIYVSS